MKSILFLLLFSITVVAQWTNTNFPDDRPPNHIAIVDNFIFVASDSNRLYRSSDNGASWEITNNGIIAGSIKDLIFNESANPASLFAATDSGVYKSTDYGNSWSLSNNGITDNDVWTLYYADNYMFAGCFIKNFRSTDYGDSWAEMAVGDPSQEIRDFLLYGNLLFAGLQNLGTNIYKSTDYGLTWDPSDNGIPSDVGYLERLDTRLFAAFYATIYESPDHGNSWTEIFSGLPPGYPITEMKTFSDYMFISALSGVYILHKDSASARNITDNLSFTSVISLDVNNELIVSGLFNFPAGVYELWTRPTSDITTYIVKQEEFLVEFSISQNYPNPFNPATEIEFQIPRSGVTRLKVYDNLGREVKTLVNARKPAGTYTVQWDGTNDAGQPVASGIYLYRLRVGNKTAVGKMLLVR